MAANLSKKFALLCSSILSMQALRLVISTAGFCAVRFHIDCELFNIFISRLVNAALIGQQFGNWLGHFFVFALDGRWKLVALAAANWAEFLCFCTALFCIIHTEIGHLSGFYWSMATANLFHKTGEAPTLSIAAPNATDYYFAGFTLSGVWAACLKALVMIFIGTDYSHPFTVVGARSVKATVDYRAAKWLFILTIAITFLMCSAWTVPVAVTKNTDKVAAEVKAILEGDLHGVKTALEEAGVRNVDRVRWVSRERWTSWKGFEEDWVTITVRTVHTKVHFAEHATRTPEEATKLEEDMEETKVRRRAGEMTYEEGTARDQGLMKAVGAFKEWETRGNLDRTKFVAALGEAGMMVGGMIPAGMVPVSGVETFGTKVNEAWVLENVWLKASEYLSGIAFGGVLAVPGAMLGAGLGWVCVVYITAFNLADKSTRSCIQMMLALGLFGALLFLAAGWAAWWGSDAVTHWVLRALNSIDTAVFETLQMKNVLDMASAKVRDVEVDLTALMVVEKKLVELKMALNDLDKVTIKKSAGCRGPWNDVKWDDLAEATKNGKQVWLTEVRQQGRWTGRRWWATEDLDQAFKAVSAVKNTKNCVTAELNKWQKQGYKVGDWTNVVGKMVKHLQKDVSVRFRQALASFDEIRSKAMHTFNLTHLINVMAVLFMLLVFACAIGGLAAGAYIASRDAVVGVTRVMSFCQLIFGIVGALAGMAAGVTPVVMDKKKVGNAKVEGIWVEALKTPGPAYSPWKNVLMVLAAMIGLGAGTFLGACVGLIIGCCTGSKKSGTAAGALVGGFVGLFTGEIYISYKTWETSTSWVNGTPGEKGVIVSCGVFIVVGGLGTVYSIYPGMAPCSITQFKYFNFIDTSILALSAIVPFLIIYADLANAPWKLALTILANKDEKWVWVTVGILFLLVTNTCEIIVICVMQHPESKLAQKVTSSPWRAGTLTIAMATSQLTSTTIGFGCVPAGSGFNDGVINANSTLVFWTMEFTGVLGEGYLTELKKYEPGHRPTQGMGKWDTYWWWNGKAFTNAWQIWSCICTTDLRRDIMLCRQ